jgi:hypothetical protein
MDCFGVMLNVLEADGEGIMGGGGRAWILEYPAARPWGRLCPGAWAWSARVDGDSAFLRSSVSPAYIPVLPGMGRPMVADVWDWMLSTVTVSSGIRFAVFLTWGGESAIPAEVTVVK